jgi:hypothetical protein
MKTRTLVDAQDAVYAADYTANDPTHYGTYGTSGAVSFAGSAFYASGNSLCQCGRGHSHEGNDESCSEITRDLHFARLPLILKTETTSETKPFCSARLTFKTFNASSRFRDQLWDGESSALSDALRSHPKSRPGPAVLRVFEHKGRPAEAGRLC